MADRNANERDGAASRSPLQRVVHSVVWRVAAIPELLRMRRRLRLFESASPKDQADVEAADLGRIVAFYLPQFHPIPENDHWWGRGFTEWTNVAGARPEFPGHRQPRVPKDLGFYDLRLRDTRIAQAELAERFGIEGFCYWHYWFHGRRLLDRPFQEVLDGGEPGIGFCLAWANESWTRTWLGEGESLLEQTYSELDDQEHAEWLATAFADPRYLRFDGRPIFLVYRPHDHPDPHRFLRCLELASERRGLPRPYTIGINGWDPFADARAHGFDGTLDFQPQLGDLPAIDRGPWWPSLALRRLRYLVRSKEMHVYRHREFYIRMVMRRLGLPFEVHPSLLVAWDNTPRRGHRSTVVVDSHPDMLRKAVADHLVDLARHPRERQLLFVNAWNEWAEGNYLEPDVEFGLAWLEALNAGRVDAARRLRRPSD